MLVAYEERRSFNFYKAKLPQAPPFLVVFMMSPMPANALHLFFSWSKLRNFRMRRNLCTSLWIRSIEYHILQELLTFNFEGRQRGAWIMVHVTEGSVSIEEYKEGKLPEETYKWKLFVEISFVLNSYELYTLWYGVLHFLSRVAWKNRFTVFLILMLHVLFRERAII